MNAPMSLVARRAAQKAESAAQWTVTCEPVNPRPTLEAFYASVLPAQGHFCLLLLPPAQHVWTESLEGLAALTRKQGERTGVYFGTACFKTPDNRKQANVLALRALRLDIDAGRKKQAANPEGSYPTREDSLAAVVEAQKRGLPRPGWVISSGEGLHLYWPLDAHVEPQAWEPVAQALQAAGSACGLRIDSSCTTDTARILRPPGTVHSEGRVVSVLYGPDQGGLTYALDKLDAALRLLAPVGGRLRIVNARRTGSAAEDAILALAADRKFDAKALAVNADVLGPARSNRRDRSVEVIAEGCAVVRSFIGGTPLPVPCILQPFQNAPPLRATP
ncbi:hypothetical protein [Variovorax sp. GT1P44]|uniref:hypothetical protein n=1 Tax=Variovorax sp. GT1P44 TaxID=3443742 RepID=UPI003F49011E